MSWSRLITWMHRYAASTIALLLCFAILGHGVRTFPLPANAPASTEPSRKTATVILDAGHGGEDCGAIGVNGVYEKDINLAVCGFLTAQLRAGGIEVVATRTEDHLLYDPATVPYGHRKSTDLANRAAFGARYENAVFVSIHMNSFPSEKYDGLQVWYGNGNEAGRSLAEEIRKTVIEKLQPSNRRLTKPSNGTMYLLDYVECPSVLVECGFLTNRAECEKLSSEDYQKELSFVLFCAIMNYLNAKEQGST